MGTFPIGTKVDVIGFLQHRYGIAPGYWYAERWGAAVMAPTKLEHEDVVGLETVLVDEMKCH
jgi:hypothetical protein